MTMAVVLPTATAPNTAPAMVMDTVHQNDSPAAEEAANAIPPTMSAPIIVPMIVPVIIPVSR